MNGRSRPPNYLFVVNGSPSLLERARIALESLSWVIRPQGIEIFDHLAEEPLASVVMVDLRTLSSLSYRPLIVPILGYGSPAVFGSLPPGACDDVVSLSFSADELRYRVLRLAEPAFVCDDGVLQCRAGRLTGGSVPVPVTDAQARTLRMLFRSGGQPVPREAMRAVFPRPTAQTDRQPSKSSRALDMHVSRLRGVLREATAAWSNPPEIVATHGHGYRLVQSYADTVPPSCG